MDITKELRDHRMLTARKQIKANYPELADEFFSLLGAIEEFVKSAPAFDREVELSFSLGTAIGKLEVKMMEKE